MPQQVRTPKRADSDLLARLCKRYGHVVLAAIEAGNSGIRKGALKAKLITYYYNLEGEWSREREKADWKGHDLATLKYETTRLLIAVLARDAPVGSQDLYHDIAEINWAIEHGILNVALGISQAAQELASAREEYGILYELLECEERILERLDKDDLMAEKLEDCATRQRECFLQLRLTHECAQIRKQVYDPIKKIREAGEVVPSAMLERLQQALSGVDPNQLLGAAAKVDYYAAYVLRDLLASDLEAAVQHSESLLDAYAATPWYSDKHTARYVSQLRATCMLFSMTARYEAAERIIDGFHRLHKRYPARHIEINYSQVLCTLFHSYYANKKSFSEEVTNSYLEKEDEFEKSISDKDWLQLNWVGMVRCLHFDEMRFAYRFGRRIVSRKANAKKNILIAARMALFACETLLFTDDEELINYSYQATDNFLKRNGSDYPNCRAILKVTKALWASSRSGVQDRWKKVIKGQSLKLTDQNGYAYFDFEPILMRI